MAHAVDATPARRWVAGAWAMVVASAVVVIRANDPMAPPLPRWLVGLAAAVTVAGTALVLWFRSAAAIEASRDGTRGTSVLRKVNSAGLILVVLTIWAVVDQRPSGEPLILKIVFVACGLAIVTDTVLRTFGFRGTRRT